jgi:benzoyl-CoA-dihydrodiol lyase
MAAAARHTPVATFETHPSRYKHWTLSVEPTEATPDGGRVARLVLDIAEENGLRSDYPLKQNSYDLGVDIELHDALERLRFEHPDVRAVVVTAAPGKVFCSGANIYMLGSSTHHFKVNFCKYTNETRCGVEEALAESGQVWIAALNGVAAGGGYELALACDRIALIDDRSSAVSLPEVPLLGVLPGTGGLTRLVDKRKVRRDLADVFCTKAEGFRAKEALRMGLIDHSFPRSSWDAGVEKLARDQAARHPTRSRTGVALRPVEVVVHEDGGRTYPSVTLRVDVAARTADITLRAPTGPAPADDAALRAEGCEAWSFRVWRELDDALLHLRFNFPSIGLVTLRTEGDAAAVLAHDAALTALAGDWFADEVRFFQGRTLRRLDNMAKSMFAVVEPKSCFVGVFAEVMLAADRSYMLADDDGENAIVITEVSDGRLRMSHGLSRLANRFAALPGRPAEVLARHGEPIDAEEAFDLGLVTMTPDSIDWDDELRIAIEERVSLSPDALTGMEQNLRLVGPETCETRIYGRLSAWQNWIFQRPNAVGDHGALTLYGHPEQPRFDWGRT